ncbi:MAG: twin-arginine translocation signal domain-containing protein, partial [Bacteroidales bacterium]|nr:twin-arginine translocation signal domain-containing protein [Bacteroidales bacterium]
MENRRDFLKKGAVAAVAAPLLASACKPSDKDRYGIELDSSVKSKLIVEKANALPI